MTDAPGSHGSPGSPAPPLRFLALCTGALLVAAALTLGLERFHRLPPADAALHLAQAQRLISPADRPADLADDDWQAVSLPDDWMATAPDALRIWYRFPIELEEPPEDLQALLLPGVNLAARVWIGDVALGGSERDREPLSQDWNRPLLVTIPPGRLRAGENLLHVAVSSYPAGAGFMAPAYFGAQAALEPSASSRWFVQVELTRFVTFASFGLALLLATIWWLRRREREYGWLALATLLWGLHALKYHVSAVPVTGQPWAAFLYLTAIGCASSISLFTLDFARLERPRLRRAIGINLALALVLIPLCVALGTDLVYRVAELLTSIIIAIGGITLAQMMWQAWRSDDLDGQLMGGAVLVLLLMAFRDWLAILGVLDRSAGQYTAYAVPFLFAVLGGVLVLRFARALGAAERFTDELEATVRERTRELEERHARIKELEREQALADERERLMRDMHDGVGGHLVSALAMVKTPDFDPSSMEGTLRDALTDLRLVIDSLDTVDGDLGIVLGMLRQRMTPRLAAAGLEVAWQLDRLPPMDHADREQVLQVLRILQEALTNVVKHAGASRVTVSAEVDQDAGTIVIGVRDDGRGLSGETHGRGLRNMRLRASSIGAELEVLSDGDGTLVRVRLARPTPA